MIVNFFNAIINQIYVWKNQEIQIWVLIKN